MRIIGEAARNVSSSFREANPELPWGHMVGIRNKLIHDYFQVNLFIVWDTVHTDLPPLKREVGRILEMLEEEDNKSEKPDA